MNSRSSLFALLSALLPLSCEFSNQDSSHLPQSERPETLTDSALRFKPVRMNPSPTLPVTIQAHPQSQTIELGSAVTFSVTVSGSNPIYFQWERKLYTPDGSASFYPIENSAGENATGSTYTFTPSLADKGNQYRAKIANEMGSVFSDAALLTIVAPNQPPFISQHPQHRIIHAGSMAEFSVAAIGIAPMTYQWMRDGVDLPGATGSNLAFIAQTGDHGTNYSARVTNPNGSSISVPANLEVIAQGVPIITVQPTNQTVSANSQAVFTVIAAGPNLSYQWIKNGAIAGSNSPVLSFIATSSDDQSTIRVKVYNSYGVLLSQEVHLYVNP